MLSLTAKEGHAASHVHGQSKHLPQIFAFRSFQILLSSSGTLLEQNCPFHKVAPSYQMYSLLMGIWGRKKFEKNIFSKLKNKLEKRSFQ